MELLNIYSRCWSRLGKMAAEAAGGMTGRLCSPAVHLAPALLPALSCCESPSAPHSPHGDRAAVRRGRGCRRRCLCSAARVR